MLEFRAAPRARYNNKVTKNQKRRQVLAIQELKDRLVELFGRSVELRIFGSVARGEDTRYSDIDLLVLLPHTVDTCTEVKIFDSAYDMELKYGVVFGVVVYDKEFWHSELASFMPLHHNIDREGVVV
jgi:predicted nucleotidyltransferase